MQHRKMKGQVTLNRMFVMTSRPYDGKNLVVANLRCRNFFIITSVNSALTEYRGRLLMGAQQLGDK